MGSSIYLFLLFILLSFLPQTYNMVIGTWQDTDNPGTYVALVMEGVFQFMNETGDEHQLVLLEYELDRNWTTIVEDLSKQVDITLVWGFELNTGVYPVAVQYPESKFISIDNLLDDLPNVISTVFAEDESGYLAGVLGGSLSKSKIGACIGGIPIPAVKRFCNGFKEGFYEICPDCVLHVDYADGWVDQVWGEATAVRFVEQYGADIVFGAGGGTGSFGILKAAEYDDVYVIGVDADEYLSTFSSSEYKNKIIGSAIKMANVASYLSLKDAVKIPFQGHLKRMDVSVGGVDLSDCHDTCHLFTKEVNDTISNTRDALSGGKSTTLSSGGDSGGLTTETKDQWFAIPAWGHSPSSRSGVTMVEFKDEFSEFVLLYGADSNDNHDFYRYHYSYSGDAYSSILTMPNNWTEIFPTNTNEKLISSRRFHSASNYQNKAMIVFGGELSTGKVTNQVLMYDLEKNEWEILSEGTGNEYITGRTQHAAGLIGNKLVVYGGIDELYILQDDIWTFDLSTRKWSKQTVKGDIPPRRNSMAYTVLNGALWVFGGYYRDWSNDLMFYNVTTNQFKILKINNKPEARRAASMCSLDSQLLLFGGNGDSSEYSDTWIYDLVTNRWEKMNMPNTPPASSYPALVVVQDLTTHDKKVLLFIENLRKNSLWSFYPEPPPTTEVIDCDGERKFTVTGNFETNWDEEIILSTYYCDGYYDCSNKYDEPTSCSTSIELLFIIFGILNGVMILSYILLAVWLSVNLGSSVVKAASPIFLFVMLIGSTLLMIAPLLSAMRPNTAQCIIIPWVWVFGFYLLFGSILIKNWRICTIFLNQDLRKMDLSTKILFGKLAVWGIPNLVILFLNSVVGGVKSELQDDPDDDNKEHYFCSTNTAFLLLLILYQVGLLLYGARLAFLTRSLSTRFNESKYIGLSVYTFCTVAIFVIPINILLSDPVALTTMNLIANFLGVNITIGLMFIPKVFLHKASTASSTEFSRSTNSFAPTAVEISEDSLNEVAKLTPEELRGLILHISRVSGVTTSIESWLKENRLRQ